MVGCGCRQSWYMTKGRRGHPRKVSRGYYSDTWVAGQFFGHVVVTSHRSVLDFEFDIPGGVRIRNGRRVSSKARSLSISSLMLRHLSPSSIHAGNGASSTFFTFHEHTLLRAHVTTNKECIRAHATTNKECIRVLAANLCRISYLSTLC